MHGLIVPEAQEAEVDNGRKCKNLMASTAHMHDRKCFICSWIQDLTLHRHYNIMFFFSLCKGTHKGKRGHAGKLMEGGLPESVLN